MISTRSSGRGRRAVMTAELMALVSSLKDLSGGFRQPGDRFGDGSMRRTV